MREGPDTTPVGGSFLDPRATLEDVQDRAEDVAYAYVDEWKETTGRKAVGHFPVYTPRELIHAAGALPVGVMGAWGQVEVDYADARVQSFVCSIARSTLELGLTSRLDGLDGMVFTDICDVARNLSGVWGRNFPGLVEYLHLPQNVRSPAAVPYLRRELDRFRRRLAAATGTEPDDEALAESIERFNEQRALLDALYAFRGERPWDLPAREAYLLTRGAAHLPVEDHVALVERALDEAKARGNKARDNIRVLLLGPYCEQPPLEFLRVLEEAGCYVVDDELLRGIRWHTGPVEADGDPLGALAESYLRRAHLSSACHPGRPRAAALMEWLGRTDAQGVVFASAKFCEPALYDYVLYKEALEAADVPYLHLEFEEKMSAFESTQLQVETFVESILFA